MLAKYQMKTVVSDILVHSLKYVHSFILILLMHMYKPQN